MSTPKPMPAPLKCPLCGHTAHIIVGLGNHFVGCISKGECLGRHNVGIAVHKRKAINDWNRWAAATKTPKAASP